MKLCKDCKYFEPEFSCHGGSLLPGFFYAREALCKNPEFAQFVQDPVGGNHRFVHMFCKDNRADELKCGLSGHKFEPATLDGRLAMLDGDHESKN